MPNNLMLNRSNTTLREPIEQDIDFLVSLRNDIDLQILLMTKPRPNTPSRVREWLSKRLNDEQGIFFIIAEKATNKACGYIQLTNIDFVSGIGQLGICLAQSAQGQGYAVAALSLLEEYAQNMFNVRKIILQVLLTNSRAISFYKKMCYSEVGIYKQHFYYQQMFHDAMLMEKILT